MAGHKISTDGMRELGRMKKLVLGEQPGVGGPVSPQRAPGARVKGKLTEDMTAGALDAPTTFTFDMWFPNPGEVSDTPGCSVSALSSQLGVTGANYTSAAASSGTMIKAEWTGRCWELYWVDC